MSALPAPHRREARGSRPRKASFCSLLLGSLNGGRCLPVCRSQDQSEIVGRAARAPPPLDGIVW